MLSSLGFDPKGTSRNNRTGPSRFLPDMMSRGLSVHVFKNALVPSQPAQPPPAPKYDPAQARPPTNNGGAPWNRQMSYQASRSESDRKQAPVALSQDRRLVQVPQAAATNQLAMAWPVDTKYGKTQAKGFSIHPSLEHDMYIYERSILSADDGLSSSPSSDESSDSELFPETTLALARLEISSTRASSSTETLESTLYNTARNSAGGGAPLSRPPLAITAPPPPPPPHPHPPHPTATIPVIPVRPPLVRTETSFRPRTTSLSHAVHPIQFAGADARSDSSDSDTLFFETDADNMVVDMLGASRWAMGAGVAARSTTPFRRDSQDSQPRAAPRARRESLEPASRSPAAPQGRSPTEEPSYPRAPPGLYGVATPPDAEAQHASGQSPPRGAAASSVPGPSTPPASASSRVQQQQQQMQMSKSTSGSPPQLARTTSSARAPEAPARYETSMSTSPPRSSPPRRDSGSSTAQGSPTQQPEGVLVVAPSKRSVRWTENLVCPSPVPPEQRRKGWFNRRGDQLWTNDGQFKMPEPGMEYPPDLSHYPEPSVGWMNEEGVRIDMQHRLVPKRPLRSALKQPKSTV